MNAPIYLKNWADEWEWVSRAMLLFILLSGLTQFTLFGLVNNYMLAYFDAQPEDVSFSTNIAYAAIIGGLPMQARFLQYFEIRNYLLTVIVLGIGISILSFHATNIHVFMVCRFFNGFIINGTVLSSLRLIMSRLKPEYAPVGFSVFYGALLGSGFSSGSLVYLVTDNMDWRDVYLYLLIIQVTSLMVVLLLVRARTGMRPYPLYQLDWSSLILLLTTLVAWAYTLIYGGKYYWLSDGRIRISLTIAICSLVAMIYRQTIMKRPYVHPVVLRIRKLIFGVLLLTIYFGIKDSINLVYQYVVQVLHWETKDLILLSACNTAGLVTAMFVAAEMILSRKFPTPVFLLTGFSLLLAFNLWAYYTFSTDLSFGDLAGAVVLQGLASGFLFVPIILLIMDGLPAYVGYTGVVMGALARFAATCNSYAGLYALQLFYNQHYRQTFLRHLTSLDDVFSRRLDDLSKHFISAGYAAGPARTLAARTVSGEMGVQNQLLTDMAIFRLFAFIILGVMVLVIIVPRIFAFFGRKRQAPV